MSPPQNVIAMIFDFDDTLTDDSTTQLLRHHGINTEEFWKTDFAVRIEDGWDPALAYLSMILECVGEGRALGKMTNKALREFGATLEFYPGIPGMFEELKEITSKFKVCNPKIEFYIISGGLEEIIRGSSIASHVDGIYGCRFATDNDGVICAVKNVISFTEKTRFIFEINKGIGISGEDSRTNPYNVNKAKSEDSRRIPLKNMIYVGDGLTDVPCFSLLQHNGGRGFGVFEPSRDGSSKKAWQQLLAPQRITSLNAPKYRSDDELGSLLRVAVTSMCQDLEMEGKMALR